MIHEKELHYFLGINLGKRARCSRCGHFGHVSTQCTNRLNAPLETPGHSGPYQGTLPVRTIPAGVCGEDLKDFGNWQGKASKGHLVQSRNALANRRDKNGRFSR